MKKSRVELPASSRKTAEDMQIVDQIIRAALSLEAIKIAQGPDALIPAPGKEEAILNDTRLHLSHVKSRKLITRALGRVIAAQKLQFSAIVATVTAGLPWAASLSNARKSPLCILHQGRLLEIVIALPSDLSAAAEHDVIAGTDLTIAEAMLVAERLNKPFIYVRQQSHRFGKDIEGAYDPGQSVYLVAKDGPKADRAAAILAHQGLKVTLAEETHTSTHNYPQAKGKTFIVLDDLVTSPQHLREASIIKKLKCTPVMLTIFDQKDAATVAQAKEESIAIHSVANLEEILLVAAADGYVTKEHIPAYLRFQAGHDNWQDAPVKAKHRDFQFELEQ